MEKWREREVWKGEEGEVCMEGGKYGRERRERYGRVEGEGGEEGGGRGIEEWREREVGRERYGGVEGEGSMEYGSMYM